MGGEVCQWFCSRDFTRRGRLVRNTLGNPRSALEADLLKSRHFPDPNEDGSGGVGQISIPDEPSPAGLAAMRTSVFSFI